MDQTVDNVEKENAAEALKAAAEAAEAGDEGAVKQEEPVAEEVSVAELLSQIEAANNKATESYEQYVRAVAEMENVRRRCSEDVRKARLFGIESFAKNLLPVMDSFERAIEAVKEAEPAVKEGLEITYKQLSHALEVSGMTVINPVNEAFNPEVAQAIAMVPGDETHPSGTVMNVFQKGWKLNDRVLRAAMVSVAQ